MNILEIVKILEEIAPPALAEDFDEGKIGLILDVKENISKIAIALDPTIAVIEQAAKIKADLLITHHTLIFNPITIISKSLSSKLKILLNNEISFYSMHTNYDNVKGGVNDILAEKLGLYDIKELPVGRIGKINTHSTSEFAKHVSVCLNTSLQYIGEKNIETVMVVGGSGFTKKFLDIAKEHSVDAFVSSELKHSVALDYKDIVLIDATHYATENPSMKKLSELLNNMIEVEIEFIDSNPNIKTINYNCYD